MGHARARTRQSRPRCSSSCLAPRRMLAARRASCPSFRASPPAPPGAPAHAGHAAILKPNSPRDGPPFRHHWCACRPPRSSKIDGHELRACAVHHRCCMSVERPDETCAAALPQSASRQGMQSGDGMTRRWPNLRSLQTLAKTLATNQLSTKLPDTLKDQILQ